MKYKNLLFLLSIINNFNNIHCEIYSDLHIKNNTEVELTIMTYCDISTLSKGTELIIPKNGEGIIEGTARFFGCGKTVGWSEKASILFQIGLQRIGPLKACDILNDLEPIGYIIKFEDKYFLKLDNPERVIISE